MDRKTSSEESHEDYAEEMHEPTASERVAMQMHRGDDDDSSFSDDVPDTTQRDYDAASSSVRRRRKKKKKTERSRATESRVTNSSSNASSVEEGVSEPCAAVIHVLNNSNEENTNELNPRDDLEHGSRVEAPASVQTSAVTTSPVSTAVAAVATPENEQVYPGAFAIEGPGGTHNGPSYSQTPTSVTDPAPSLLQDERISASEDIVFGAELVQNDDQTLLNELYQRLQQRLVRMQSVTIAEENANEGSAGSNHLMREQYGSSKMCTLIKSKRNRRCLIAFALALVVVTSVLVVMLGRSNGTPTELPRPLPKPPPTPLPTPSPTPLPTPAPVTPELKNLIISVSLDAGASLEYDSSPQSRALSWLQGNTFINEFPDWKKIQRYVLATLYYSTNGMEWDDSSGWLSDDNECEWHFNCFDVLSCKDGQHISSVCLLDNGLEGIVPQELALLSNSLEYLNLRINQITGSLPTEIGLLSELKRVDLRKNQITGSLPTEIGLLSELKRVDLYENQITGSLPTEIGLLSELKRVDLHENQITGSLPTEIGLLSELNHLYLDGNLITGSLPTEIGLLFKLNYLYLHTNQITGSLPTEIGLLTSLTQLSLSDNVLGGAIPRTFETMTNLNYLRLHGNDFDGEFECPSFIEHCYISCYDYPDNTNVACHSL